VRDLPFDISIPVSFRMGRRGRLLKLAGLVMCRPRKVALGKIFRRQPRGREDFSRDGSFE
jgi:hypothetical protein